MFGYCLVIVSWCLVITMDVPRRPLITPNITLNIFIGIVILGILSYFAWQVYPVFRAPELMVFEPATDLYTANSNLMLRGNAESGARLTVNREEVYVDESGNFSQPLVLTSGVNVIDSTAEGRFGRRTRVTRYIIYSH